ncbi:uncharacterized protein LOC107810954 [Nicotiana tabacum]|uniref:Uncharacterized protein LOC107810954 n=1 Tax=Nicotiana tabacum TaxID=4097 RepID=A0A1S4BQV6_TOBAC|nr:PREDICTED: uncharacterized protein LOC107810954 [Nicotiana tabacum]
MEYLNRQLRTFKRQRDFNFRPKCARMNITHLGFTDDLLLFCRGNFVSVQMLYNCFQIFSQASGLVANADKSSIYFGGVCKDDQNAILQALGFTKGELPFRYLGIPLSTKRTNVLQYKPLLDKILNKITSWTFSFLSYAGRLQFIKSVLFSIQIFWSQVFVLPKKVVQLIESLCKRFLWTCSVDMSRKALIAWERLCYPKAAGGLGLLDVHAWNAAAICKLLWNLCKKKDKLWVQWVHIYYVKGRRVWDSQANQASWVIRKILKAKLIFEKVGILEQDVYQMDSFSIKKLYCKIRGDCPKVEWRRLICSNHGAPRWTFILYLAIYKRLLTKDRVAQLISVDSLVCPLCNDRNESADHVFFSCHYSFAIWDKLLQWQGINRVSGEWKNEVDWAVKNSKGRSTGAIIYRMTLACGVYCIWHERNLRLFQQRSRPASALIRQVIQEVHYMLRLQRKLEELSFIPKEGE